MRRRGGSPVDGRRRLTCGIKWILPVGLLAVAMMGTGVALGDMVKLNDGRVFEGQITRESDKYVKMDTRYGSKTFRRHEIEELVKESSEGSALDAIQRTDDFAKLSDLARELKNAEALYDLGQFDDIPERVTPLIGKGAKVDDMRIRWLLIETYERQAKWDDVQALLDQTLQDGREPDKIRAKAHKDIFDQNAGYTLRKIGDTRTEDFLSREDRDRGRKINSIQNADLMRAALLEYINQLLVSDEVNLYELQDSLDVEESLRLVMEQIEMGSRSVLKALPYRSQVEHIEKVLYKVNAILPGYARGYELELARTEAEHLQDVMFAVLARALEIDPDRGTYATEGESNRLTKEAREQWRDACDRYLTYSKPLVEIAEYVLEKIRPHPVELGATIDRYEDILDRFQQLLHATQRRRDRSTL